MKRLLNVFLVLGIVVCATSLANAQNILINPNLDAVDPPGTQQLGSTPTDWIVDASRGGVGGYFDAVESTGFSNHNAGGTNGLFFKAFTGNPPWDPLVGSVDVDVYQDNPGTPGMRYRLKGWAGAEPNYSGLATPGEQSFLAIDFLSGGLPIGSTTLALEGAGLGQPGGEGGFNWRQFVVLTGAAPALTDGVRARVTMEDGVFNMDPGQAFVADQFTLECIPEPASVVLCLVGMLGVAGLARRR